MSLQAVKKLILLNLKQMLRKNCQAEKIDMLLIEKSGQSIKKVSLAEVKESLDKCWTKMTQ